MHSTSKTLDQLSHFAAGLANRVFYPDSETLWSQAVTRRIMRLLSPDDVVITCARPESVGYIGAAAQARGAVWWLDLADGWCWQGIRHRASPPSAKRHDRERALERRWIKKAHGVSTVNPILGSYFRKVREGDVFIYPHVFPKELLGCKAPSVPAEKLKHDIPILYFGRLRMSVADHSLQQLRDILLTHKAGNAKPSFIFVGQYTYKDHAEFAEIRAMGFSVKTIPAVPRKSLIEIASSYGVAAMLVVNPPGSLASTSKIYDAFTIGMPVWLFASPEADSTALVKHYGKGIVVPPHAADLNLDETLRSLVRLQGQTHNGQFLDGRNQVDKLCEFMESALMPKVDYE